MPIRQLTCILVLGTALLAQNRGAAPVGTPESPSAAALSPQTTAPASDDMAQMRLDLSRMESLNNNMSAEIEFLHDQNLQILLRTNAQMWTMLIRDLRQQLDHEGPQEATQPKPAATPPPDSNPSPR